MKFNTNFDTHYYMTKCATCNFHAKDKRMENAWFSPKHNQTKTMRLSKRFPRVYPNAWKTHMAQLAMYESNLLTIITKQY